MRNRTLIIFLLFFLGLLGIKALLTPGFYTSHDGLHHTVRIANFFLALKDGQLPVRWAQNLNGFLGSPIFSYIYPLPYFLGALLHYLGLTVTDSFKAVLGGAYLLSGITFYLWLEKKLGKIPALVGAVFYLWAPYRFLMIFVRAAYAESIAYAFIPPVFLAIDEVFGTGNRKWIAVGAFATGLLMLAHNLVAFIFLPLGSLYAALLLYRTRKWSGIFHYALFSLLGFCLAAFIYIPDVLERSDVRFDQVMNYSAQHLVAFWQFFRSPWGYGFSFPGTANDMMSFQIGLGQILTVFLAVIVVPVALILKKKIYTGGDKYLFIFALFCLGLTVILMTDIPPVVFLWKNVNALSTIDYPWRLLGVTVFSSAILGALLVRQIPGRILQLGGAVLLVMAVIIANRNHTRINEVLNYRDDFLFSFAESGTQLGEFTPKDRLAMSFPPVAQRAQLIGGQGKIIVDKITSHFQEYTITVATASSLRLNTLYFPGWRVNLDGKAVPLDSGLSVSGSSLSPDGTDYSGTMLVSVPAGTHDVTAQFGETPVRKFSDLISLGALAITLVIFIV